MTVNNDSALHSAVFGLKTNFSKSEEGLIVLRKILECVPDVNVLPFNGYTALMTASYEGRERWVSIILLLLEYGADPSVVNDQGKSAINRLGGLPESVFRKAVLDILLDNAEPKIEVEGKYTEDPIILVERHCELLFDALEKAWIWGKENDHPSLLSYPRSRRYQK